MFKKKKRKRGDLSRREFMYVALGGSTALFGMGACGVTAWALQPRLRYGVDLFQIDLSKIPVPEADPLLIVDKHFWVINKNDGLRALSCTCPHLGCFLKWVPVNHRFECPCHGRKHTLAGGYIEGPGVVCDLFHYNMAVKTPYETRTTNNQPIPLSLQDATEVVVDVRKKLFKPADKT